MGHNMIIKFNKKHVLRVIIGTILAVILIYGLLYWQLFRKFETVWTCDIYVGDRTLVENAKCDSYHWLKSHNYFIIY